MTLRDERMQAMVLERPGQPLRLAEMPPPQAGPGQVLIRVQTCGVCRTDLHIADGDLPPIQLPLVPGHEIVGTVVRCGPGADRLREGERVGVPWLGASCGQCAYCRGRRENLCDQPTFTGYTIHGGYAQYTVADERYCFRLPERYDNLHAAPLLCAGLIGYRSYRMIGSDVGKLGLYGFGASAHIIAQIALHQGKQVYAFTRPGAQASQEFARRLGCWAGDSTLPPPEKLDAAIIFAPVGSLVPVALEAVRKGGSVVCAGIHMSDIPAFPYRLLWEERVVRSVANLQRADGEELLRIAADTPLELAVRPFALSEANEALEQLRQGRLQGAAVLVVEPLAERD